MSYPIMEKLVLRQINQWNQLRQFLNDPPVGADTQRRPVITVSRLTGSGGRQLAQELAQRLDLDLQDSSMVKKIVEDRQLENSLVGELDENTISQARLWMKGVLSRKIFMKEQYHQDLVRIVSCLAARGGVVFLGRGANLILGERADLRVRVVAGLNYRVSRIRNRLDLSRPEARALVDEVDLKRESFVQQVFQQEPGRADNYDLTLNAERLTIETMSSLVVQTLLERKIQTENGVLHGQG